MKATIRTIFAATIVCFFSLQTAKAGNNNTESLTLKTAKDAVKTNATKTDEQAHWLKGATMDHFVLPVNPMQKPVKAHLV